MSAHPQEAAPRHRAQPLPGRQRATCGSGARKWAETVGALPTTSAAAFPPDSSTSSAAKSSTITPRNEIHKYGGPGGWNDPDYLQLGYLNPGRTRLSPNAQYSHVSLWSLVAAPLIFGGDITRLDDFTLNLLCNDEVIEVDQDPLGKPGRRVAKSGDQEVWARPLEDGSLAVGLFNRGEMAATVTAKWSDLGLRGKQRVRDLWRQKDLGTLDGQFSSTVPGQGVELIRLWPAKG